MSDIERVRALLREREENEEDRGTAFAELHLKITLVEDLAKLMAERADIIKAAQRDPGDTRMAKPAEPDTADVDARIEAKKAEIKATTVRFDFRVLTSAEYSTILNGYPDVDRKQDQRNAFQDDLARAGVYKATLGDGEPITDETERLEVFDAIKADAPFGDWDQIRDVVYDLNRRKISVPF